MNAAGMTSAVATNLVALAGTLQPEEATLGRELPPALPLLIAVDPRFKGTPRA
jgi:hypothetical protein